MKVQNTALFTVCALLTALTTPARAQQCRLESKLTAPDAVDYTQLNDVALDGDVLVTGSGTHTHNVSNDGAVWVWRRSSGGWAFEQELTVVPIYSGDSFGHRVAVEGDVIVASERTGDIGGYFNTGAVRVFERTGTTWAQTVKLDPPALLMLPWDIFGGSLAISGDRIVVGAPLRDSNGLHDAGAAFVFRRTGPDWSSYVFEQELAAPDQTVSDQFGSGVAIEGNTLVVGAHVRNVGEGGAYVFTHDGTSWVHQQTLVPSTSYEFMGFGVDMDGDTIVAGATYNGLAAYKAGAAYVFRDDGTGNFALETVLTGSDLGVEYGMGESVGIDGDRVIASATGFGTGRDGIAYVFERTGTDWAEIARHRPAPSGEGDYFSSNVAISGEVWVGSAPEDDDLGINTGALYVFGSPLPPAAYCAGKTNSAGCVPSITAVGSPSASSPQPYLIQCSNVVSNEDGLFFYGTNGALAKPFLGGLRCVKGPLRRTPKASSGGNAAPDCSGSFQIDFNAYIQSGLDPALVVGAQVNGQFYFRDPADPFGAGLSNAFELAICP
jgi:hypothetical protein